MSADQHRTATSRTSNVGAPPHPFDKRWFVHLDGKTYGPHSGHQIRQLVEQQKITGTDLVCAEDSSAWTQLEDDPILRRTLRNSGAPTRHLKRRLAPRLILLIGLPVLLALGWVAWPYYSVNELMIAARTGDVPALERLVAWDSVREGLRNDLNALFFKAWNAAKENATSKKESEGLFGAFAEMLVPVMINRVIDNHVTPRAFAPFTLPQVKTDASPTDNPKPEPGLIRAAGKIRWSQIQYAFFTGPFAFRIDVIPEQDPPLRNPVTLLFNWAGNWRLTRVVLPADVLEGIAEKSKDAASSAKKPTAISADPISAAPASSEATSKEPASEATSKEPAPLDLVLRSKGFKDRNIHEGEFQTYVTLEISVKNITDKDIRAFDGVLTFTDLLDNEILSIRLAINDQVRAGATLNWKGGFEYNQFKDDHQRLRSAKKENLKLKFAPRKVLFADGSSKEYSG